MAHLTNEPAALSRAVSLAGWMVDLREVIGGSGMINSTPPAGWLDSSRLRSPPPTPRLHPGKVKTQRGRGSPAINCMDHSTNLRKGWFRETHLVRNLKLFAEYMMQFFSIINITYYDGIQYILLFLEPIPCSFLNPYQLLQVLWMSLNIGNSLINSNRI